MNLGMDLCGAMPIKHSPRHHLSQLQENQRLHSSLTLFSGTDLLDLSSGSENCTEIACFIRSNQRVSAGLPLSSRNLPRPAP